MAENIVERARELGDSTDYGNYVDRALRTECPYDPVLKRLTEDGFTGIRLLHMSEGIANETGELKEVLDKFLRGEGDLDTLKLIREEIGDLMWYSAGICYVLDMSFEEILDVMCAHPFDRTLSGWANGMMSEIVLGSGVIAEHVKKHVFYGKDYDTEKVTNALANIVHASVGLARVLGIDFESILKDNIAKLAARFPDKFTEIDAIERDKEAEYEAMGE